MRGDSGIAASQLQIEAPITEQTINGTFPGLYASNSIDMGNNRATLQASSAIAQKLKFSGAFPKENFPHYRRGLSSGA